MNTKNKKEKKPMVNSFAKIEQLFKKKNDRKINTTSKRNTR